MQEPWVQSRELTTHSNPGMRQSCGGCLEGSDLGMRWASWEVFTELLLSHPLISCGAPQQPPPTTVTGEERVGSEGNRRQQAPELGVHALNTEQPGPSSWCPPPTQFLC